MNFWCSQLFRLSSSPLTDVHRSISRNLTARRSFVKWSDWQYAPFWMFFKNIPVHLLWLSPKHLQMHIKCFVSWWQMSGSLSLSLTLDWITETLIIFCFTRILFSTVHPFIQLFQLNQPNSCMCPRCLHVFFIALLKWTNLCAPVALIVVVVFFFCPTTTSRLLSRFFTSRSAVYRWLPHCLGSCCSSRWL